MRELRGFRDRQVVSGYCDDHKTLAEAAAKLDGQEYDIYVTLNPVNPALLDRANNRVVPRPAATTADHDIVRRRRLLIDLDPVRASGVPATHEEKRAAFERLKEVRAYLRALGWPETVIADSGNGFHLLPPIDLPNDPESRELVKEVLEALAFRFDDDRVKVDTSVHNAARIVRFYGTMNRKGDHTDERPHRRSKIKLVPGGSPEEQIVSREKLEAVSRMRPVTPPKRNRQGFLDVTFRQRFDLPAWIEEQGVPIKREGEWQQNSYRWVLEECPWNGHTDNAAYIVQLPSGAIAAGCHHNSCQGYGWRDLREQYEPGCYDQPGSDMRTDLDHGTGGTGVELTAVPPFPLAVLPATSRAFIEEAAASIGCPPEFIAVPMLVAFGAAIGNSRVLELKSGWTESASLYAAVIASPGEKKTPAAKAATRPAWRQQAELKREHDEAMAAYFREKRAWDAERRRASREEAAPEPPEEPTMRRAVVEDATVEALISRLEESPWGLLCAKDELTAWVRALDQYKGGKGSDRQFWLSVWSNFFVVVDRKGRKEPIMVPRPFVGLTGSIQPGVLSELKNYREDGLLDRFLFAYPDPMPSRWSDDEISEEVMARYQELYSRLYALGMVADENGEPSPEHVVFAPGAKEMFVEEVNSLREEMEYPGFPDHLKGPWSKLEAYLARLALILALVRIVESENVLAKAFEAVLEPDVEAAVELLKYFKAHARRAYAKLHGERPEYLLAEALKVFLREAGGAWEGQTSELYEVLKGRSAPGLPGGTVPFGKQLREIAGRGLGIVLEGGWRGSAQVIKLALSTPGTPGNESLNESEHEAPGGTGGKTG